MKKSKHKPNDVPAQCDPNAPASNGVSDGSAQDSTCDHNWQPDGQTLTAVRWTCTKCHKTQLNGLEM